MTKGERITIERVANGYLVRPEHESGMPMSVGNFMVFNDMGYYTGGTNQPCLLGFIEEHFRQESK